MWTPDGDCQNPLHATARVRMHAERAKRIRMLSHGLAREFAELLGRRPSIEASEGWELKNLYGPLQFWIEESGSRGGPRVEIRLVHRDESQVLFQSGPRAGLDA